LPAKNVPGWPEDHAPMEKRDAFPKRTKCARLPYAHLAKALNFALNARIFLAKPPRVGQSATVTAPIYPADKSSLAGDIIPYPSEGFAYSAFHIMMHRARMKNRSFAIENLDQMIAKFGLNRTQQLSLLSFEGCLFKFRRHLALAKPSQVTPALA